MRNLTVFMLASMVALGGCGLLSKKADPDAGAVADADAGPTTTTAPPVAAANAAAVARFASETPLSEGRIIASVSTPRTAPKSGTVVATLKVGTEVTRVATNGTDSLITFADPSNTTVTLMGWVTDAAFSATIVKKVDAGVDAGVTVVDAGVATAVVDAGLFACPPGKSPINIGGKANCRKSCIADADCKVKKCLPGLSPPNAAPPNAPVKVCIAEL